MIYAASFFCPEHHHGRLVAISHSLPKGWNGKVDRLSILAPTQRILDDYKARRIGEAQYVEAYRDRLSDVWPTVKAWLNSLEPEIDQTLLCWEKPGQFCHRNLVLQMVQKHRPDCHGGADILAVQPEQMVLLEVAGIEQD